MAHTHHRVPVAQRRGSLDARGLHADLARRTRAGDREAFGELYRLTVDLVTAYIAVRMRDRDRDAIDDLVHDAYCDALADPGLIQPDIVGSLLRLAARACTRHQWSRNRYLRAAYTVYEDRRANGDTGPVTTTAPAAAATRVTFVHALARLTADQRRAIQLRLLDGYPRDAAAHAMGKSVAAVKSLEQRALRRLHTQLATGTAEVPAPVADRLTARAGTALAR